MKIVVQRSKRSQVKVHEEVVGEIAHGLVLFVCLENGDTREILSAAAEKIIKMRVFEDAEGKMNLDIKQVQGEILCISQFTLSWDGKKGHRPSFDKSMPPALARKYFNEFSQMLASEVPVSLGRFGEQMSVEISNDGPVTFSLCFAPE